MAAPAPFPGFWLGQALRRGDLSRLLFIAADDRAMEGMAEILALLVPRLEVLTFPAWDCLPYDRLGPNSAIAARRIDSLWRLAGHRDGEKPAEKPIAVVTTVNAACQKLCPAAVYRDAAMTIAVNDSLDLDALTAFAADQGYTRAEAVMEPGEFAIRGGIIDIYPPGRESPVRLDLFGDVVEKIRPFDPLTQISEREEQDGITLRPVSEVLLTDAAITRFRSQYRERFGAGGERDALYAAVTEGRRINGMEHWLPLFQEKLVSLFDYATDFTIACAADVDETLDLRLEQISDYFAARNDFSRSAKDADEDAGYKPLPPDCLYLDREQWDTALGAGAVIRFDSFTAPGTGRDQGGDRLVIDGGARAMQNFAALARSGGDNAFDLVSAFAKGEMAHGKRVVFTGASAGSVTRLARLLGEHGLGPIAECADWQAVEGLNPDAVALVSLDLEQGFSASSLCVIAEPDILGHRLARPRRRQRAADAFINEVSTLNPGDLVVHLEHGIGRYDGLETLQVPGSDGRRPVPHDCLRLFYEGGDKLYVPVENIEILTRYGEDQGRVALDRLGGAAWQAKKSRLKTRIREMAGELLRVAAARATTRARVMEPPEGAYEEFAARFPYTETEDQQNAIAETLADMAKDRPMDRLICGDVGFGKTEVALRAAFVAALSGTQVAVVVPTTLLARQHFGTFCTRFEGFPVEVAQLSRLVTPTDAAKIKERLAAGQIDIVIGTHALLAESLQFSDLGLLIIDEEQHFGVAHKERLKGMRTNVHVLTLTATPIPRTLQLAMTGVKEMSIIATPPVDRLAVRTFISPFDPLVVGEAIRREMHRGGQCFYVCPRIGDIGSVIAQLGDIAPDARITTAHGQMAPAALEETMAAFFDHEFDILVSTNIIESGLDLPNVNTIIIHRADMFGLGQLYQLRGRVGRAGKRAYAYLTLPPRRVLTEGAAKRLQVMQTLDSLGAGFSLASHDLDIRGAGNLLGEEQSGHIREVGIELYQHMLEETVAELKGGAETTEGWSPEINIDVPVLIPESYVTDLGLRLGLYRRLAGLDNREETDAFAAEMIDRFGALPEEVENLLAVVGLKQACRVAGIERLDAGSRGCLIAFHENRFDNPAGLVEAMTRAPDSMKLRPDHTLVMRRDWPRPKDRLEGLGRDIAMLAALAAKGGEGLKAP